MTETNIEQNLEEAATELKRKITGGPSKPAENTPDPQQKPEDGQAQTDTDPGNTQPPLEDNEEFTDAEAQLTDTQGSSEAQPSGAAQEPVSGDDLEKETDSLRDWSRRWSPPLAQTARYLTG